ncbi:CoA ester lyase [Actinomycetospora sp. Odt1-22]|uniref:CoA ester lyase n=1 Tax=Actinomycetospora termitidis TaxID=3053470 RepID=A0ABT7MEU9_9PSEU|nr:CoA ester lyase [Actinomycetospora sp. Odt1-22]MDL5159188.1 CoA ester lyase [Actinomycetospora sp. Odt1-22]
MPRSLLFVPGDRPDMVAKAPRSSPDAIAVDLEDAVAPGDKDEARRTAVHAVGDLPDGGSLVLVRVNPPATPWHDDDVEAVAGSRAGVVLPKYEDPAQLRDLRRRVGDERPVVVGIETARGVARVRDLLDGSEVTAAYFGAEDYIASVGGRRTPSSREVLFARSEVLLAARLAGVGALDQAVVAVRDGEFFRRDAGEGRDLGYDGKICIHPTQVTLAHEVFTPSEEEVAHARDVVEAGRAGVGVVNGEMVDDVHLRMAAATLQRAGVEA